MTKFKIGDVVRVKGDIPKERLELVIRSAQDIKSENFLCISECGRRRCWEDPGNLELVNRPDDLYPNVDIKQAIREVLLSDEFMTAFAAAWMKTPLPLAMQYNAGFEIKNADELAALPECEPTKAQSLADRTPKAIWQANDSTGEGGKQ